ncbi:MAG: MBOAT family protein, partial [Bacteroidota bacterium]
MVFSSVYFVLYFLPVFLLVYYLAPQKWKNLSLLVGSSYFYAWGEPTFFFLIFFSLILDFYLIRMMYYTEGKLKKILFTSVLVLNISMLLVYKYLMFFVYNLNFVLSSLEIPEISVLIFLPIGISFITFQKISYAVDVHRGRTEVQHNFIEYALYILLFPQLIAGPIIRYHQIKAQITDRSKAENIDNKLLGLFRFIIGLSKKLLIADPIGLFVNELFAMSPGEVSTPMLWIGI